MYFFPMAAITKHMDCNPTAFSCPWDSPGKNTGVGLPFPSPGNLPNPAI